VINGVQLWAVLLGDAAQEEEVENFALRQLDCVARTKCADVLSCWITWADLGFWKEFVRESVDGTAVQGQSLSRRSWGTCPPESGDILKIILQWCKLEESKTVFVNLALKLAVFTARRHASVVYARRHQIQVGQVKTGDFRQITRYSSKTSIVASVVNLVQSQVYDTERPPLFAACLPWYSASRGFVSDSWYLYQDHRVRGGSSAPN